MIDPTIIAEVKRLLAERQRLPLRERRRLTHRKIAAMTGISRTTVTNIANGRRRDHEPRIVKTNAKNAPKTRCPNCGAMAVMPCHACIIRASKPRRPSPPDEIGEIDFDLHPEHRARLEKIRAARQSNTLNQAPADRAA